MASSQTGKESSLVNSKRGAYKMRLMIEATSSASYIQLQVQETYQTSEPPVRKWVILIVLVILKRYLNQNNFCFFVSAYAYRCIDLFLLQLPSANKQREGRPIHCHFYFNTIIVCGGWSNCSICRTIILRFFPLHVTHPLMYKDFFTKMYHSPWNSTAFKVLDQFRILFHQDISANWLSLLQKVSNHNAIPGNIMWHQKGVVSVWKKHISVSVMSTISCCDNISSILQPLQSPTGGWRNYAIFQFPDFFSSCHILIIRAQSREFRIKYQGLMPKPTRKRHWFLSSWSN